jgi:hypothetical protein
VLERVGHHLAFVDHRPFGEIIEVPDVAREQTKPVEAPAIEGLFSYRNGTAARSFSVWIVVNWSREAESSCGDQINSFAGRSGSWRNLSSVAIQALRVASAREWLMRSSQT